MMVVPLVYAAARSETTTHTLRFLPAAVSRSGESAQGDVRDGAVSHGLGVEVVEVRRHLVQKDEDRLLALEQMQPVGLIGRLRSGGPELPEQFALAELVGDRAPEELLRGVAPVERRDVRATRSR